LNCDLSLSGRLGLSGGLGLSGPICSAGFVGGNRMYGPDCNATAVKTVPVMAVRMSDMGLGCDRSELNGDQQDRRPKHPQKRAGRSHEQPLP
jgi:hypothetical protein